MTVRRLFFFVPLLAFRGVAIFMMANLGRPQQAVVRSQMVGKALPAFSLPVLDAGADILLTQADLAQGQPVIINIFASWCLPCAVEAPHLDSLAREAEKKGVPLVGIAVQDAVPDTQSFLARHGNPYARIGVDQSGQMLVAFGASGVPETYVVDGRGIVRHQHLGEIRAEHIVPLLARVEAAR